MELSNLELTFYNNNSKSGLLLKLNKATEIIYLHLLIKDLYTMQ